MSSLSDEQVKAALAAMESPGIPVSEKIDLLMEIAMGLQRQARVIQDLHSSVLLYDRALELCTSEDTVLIARLRARKGTALNAIPHEGPQLAEQARELFESALKDLQQHGSPEEVAEIEMNLGLTLHTLSTMGHARIADAIGGYLRALRIFTLEAHPTEFAILHNNLATAYLSMPMTDASGNLREALAVQSFEEALKVVTFIDHPVEYAMLQNNLGNALQYASSSHSVENNLRALAAYEEALRIRNPDNMPMEYANTISNKANALCNIPDDPSHPECGNRNNLIRARQYLHEACDIFERFGDNTKVRQTTGAITALEEELGSGTEQELPLLDEREPQVIRPS